MTRSRSLRRPMSGAPGWKLARNLRAMLAGAGVFGVGIGLGMLLGFGALPSHTATHRGAGDARPVERLVAAPPRPEPVREAPPVQAPRPAATVTALALGPDPQASPADATDMDEDGPAEPLVAYSYEERFDPPAPSPAPVSPRSERPVEAASRPAERRVSPGLLPAVPNEPATKPSMRTPASAPRSDDEAGRVADEPASPSSARAPPSELGLAPVSTADPPSAGPAAPVAVAPIPRAQPPEPPDPAPDESLGSESPGSVPSGPANVSPFALSALHGVPSAPAPPPSARPRGRARLAIILDDIGLSRARTERAIRLPAPVTLSFLPYAPDLPGKIRRARAAGHEVMLHLPMEPMDASIDPGPDALKVGLSPAENLRRLKAALAPFDRAGGIAGINNHMGSRFTSDATALAPILAELGRRGLYFIDSLTSPRSVGHAVAQRFGVAHAVRDVFLDAKPGQAAARAALARAATIARSRGGAIAIGHPYDSTFAALEAWLREAPWPGLALVSANSLVPGGPTPRLRPVAATTTGPVR